MAWPRDAYVGQKVVCVEPPMTSNGYIPEISVDRVYTIGGIEIWYGHPYFVLNEFSDDDLWKSYAFRPVDPASKKADRGLAALKDEIKTVRQREDA